MTPTERQHVCPHRRVARVGGRGQGTDEAQPWHRDWGAQ